MTAHTTAEQWIRTRDNRTGRQFAVAVPSASQPNKFHLTSTTRCDCKGFEYRGRCRHVDQVRAEVAARKAPADSKPTPTYSDVYGTDGDDSPATKQPTRLVGRLLA
jgi:hypothetical protein